MKPHPVEACLNQDCSVNFDRWSDIQRGHASALFASGAVSGSLGTASGIMTIGVVIAWHRGMWDMVLHPVILFVLLASIIAGWCARRYFIDKISTAPLRVEGKIKELSKGEVIEGETM